MKREKSRNKDLRKKQSPLKERQPRPSSGTKKKDRNPRFQDLFGLLFILLLGVVIYFNSFGCAFQFDDLYTIVNNVKIRNLYDFTTLWNSSPNRPVAFLSFALNYHFNKLDVRYWHLVNLALHLVNAVLVWSLTMHLFSTPAMQEQKIAGRKRIVAFATALLFVSHPLATQSVTYIVQRMTSLVALFYLLSILFYIKGRMTKNGTIVKILFFAGSLLSALLAMKTKENAFTLPFIILLVEIFFLNTKKISLWVRDYRVILMIVAFLAVILIIPFRYSFGVFKPIVPAGHPESVLTPYYYLITQFSVIVKYIQLLLVPVGLNLDHDWPVSTSFFQLHTMVSFLILAGLVVLGIYLFKRQRILSFGIFWFFITQGVESGFIPINDVMVEHRTYLPSFGFLLVIITSLYLILHDRYRWIASGIVILMTLFFSFLTWKRNEVWKDDLTLWTDVVSKSPGKARAITNLGMAYANREQWEPALKYYTEALRIDPNFQVALFSRGLAYKSLGQYEKAIEDNTRSIAIDSLNGMVYNNRGICYINLGEDQKAIADFSQAIRFDPGNADAYSNRSAAYLKTGQSEKAIADINHAITLNPDNYKALLNRGAVYESLNQPQKALEDYSRVIRMKPDYAKSYFNRAAVYMKSGQPEPALADFSRAIEIDPEYLDAWFNRGVIHASLGQREKAILDYSRVIALDPENRLGYFNRGLSYGKLGKFQLAIDDFTTALRLDPGFTSARQNRDVAIQKLKMEKVH